MKKIIVSVLSLAIFFILGTVTCSAEPYHGGKADKTYIKTGSVASSRSKCLRKSEPRRGLEFKSSSEEISCVDDKSESSEEKEKHDHEYAECDDPVIMVMNARRDPQGKTHFRNALEDYLKKNK